VFAPGDDAVPAHQMAQLLTEVAHLRGMKLAYSSLMEAAYSATTSRPDRKPVDGMATAIA
jgi:hypothetical protein